MSIYVSKSHISSERKLIQCTLSLLSNIEQLHLPDFAASCYSQQIKVSIFKYSTLLLCFVLVLMKASHCCCWSYQNHIYREVITTDWVKYPGLSFKQTLCERVSWEEIIKSSLNTILCNPPSPLSPLYWSDTNEKITDNNSTPSVANQSHAYFNSISHFADFSSLDSPGWLYFFSSVSAFQWPYMEVLVTFCPVSL